MADVIPWVIRYCLVSYAVASVLRDDDFPCKYYTLEGRRHLDCSDLGLSEMPNVPDYEVEVVDLSNNNLIDIPAQLEYFTVMEELNLYGNHLDKLANQNAGIWQNLRTFNLSNNNFDSWKDYGFGDSLRKLDLSKNKISIVDEDAFKRTSSLHFLDLSENRIYDLPSQAFVEANNLDTLILSRNGFSAIPNFQSSSVRSIDLSSCSISTLTVDALANKATLFDLNLSINQIEAIPDNFASSTLQELDLSYNNLNTLTDRSFSSLPHLAVLHLRGNDFRDVFPTSIFASNPFLREVTVKGNRWSCEGFSVNLLVSYEYLTREPAKVGDKASLICYSPSNVTQMSWQEAYIQTWHPEEAYSTLTWAAVMIGIIIGIVLTSVVCRTLMPRSKPEPETVVMPAATALNLNGGVDTRVPRRDTVVLRIPLTEDLPPSYDEALLMPRLNSSFHSLPDFIDEGDDGFRRFRRSRSIGDLIESRPRSSNRRSTRPTTIEINIE